jgi:hypothetical protein
MRVVGSNSAQLRDARVTLRAVKRDVRWVREDVNGMTRKLDVVTAHLETVNRKLDKQLRVMIYLFMNVVMLLAFMSYLIHCMVWRM